MKKVMMALFAIAFAAKVEAAGTIMWTYTDGNIPASGSIYLFALGNAGPYDENSFGNGSFNAVELTLTPTGGSALWAETTPDMADWGELNSTMFHYSIGDLPSINQWWAVVVVSDDTPYSFDIDVFEVSGLVGEYPMWVRGLIPNAVEFTSTSPMFVQQLVDKEFKFDRYTAAAIPEPLTTGLALAGVALLLAQRRRK